MKRIAINRCGYDGYKCRPIPKLNPLFQNTHTDIYAVEKIKEALDSEFNSAWVGPSSYDPSMLVGTIDNYAQLPQQFEGFIMTLAPIINMEGEPGPFPEVPELACRVDFNPFTYGSSAIENNDPAYTANLATAETGFLDYYTQIPTYSSSVYVDVEGGTETEVNGGTVTITGLTIATDMPAYIQGSTITEDPHLGWIVGGDKITLTAGPGLLEPMLDTELPPIGIDTIPSADIIGDFAMWEFNTINQWQRLVDDRLNGLRTVIPTVDYGGVKGLYNLKNKEYQNSACGNFQISVANPLEPIIGTLDMNTPLYEISGGTIYLNGQYVSIGGVPAIDGDTGEYEVNEVSGEVEYVLAPFTAYLDVAPSGNTASVITYPGSNVTIDETKREAGHTYIYIGAVKSVSASADFPLEGGTAFKLYKIEQGDCIDEVRTNYGGSDEYPGPFVVAVGYSSATPYIYVGGFDEDSSNEPQAGKIYLNGSFLEWGPVHELENSGAEDFIYAHITITQSSAQTAVSGYTLASCTYDRTESVTPPQGTTSLVYTVRLGRILDEDVVDQIHYGDIYLYTGADAGSSTVSVVYTGPFRVQTGTVSGSGGDAHSMCVMGINNDTEGSSTVTYYAGKIFYNGKEIRKQPAADVANTLADPKFVYAKIDIDDSTSTPTATCAFTTNDNYGLVAGKKRFTIRLSEIKSYPGTGSPTLHQLHYGDIYLYGSTNTTIEVDEYKGPFKVTNTSDTSINISGCDGGSTAGIIYINGASAGVLSTLSEQTVTTGASFVYAHIGLKKTNGVYSIVSGSTYTFVANTEIAGSDYTYHVRLAKMATPKAIQVHYGDIYIDTDTFDYNGPFKVEGAGKGKATSTVTLYAFDGADANDVSYTGKAYNGEDDVFTVPCGNAISVGAASTIYAHVYLVKGSTTATSQLYMISDVVFDTTEGPSGTPPANVKKIYTYRIATVSSTAGETAGTFDIKVTQIQYGDIHLGDTSEPIVNISGSTYTGPFMVTVDTNGVASISCPDCIQPSGGTVTGKYIINGTTVHDVGYKSVATGNKNNVYLQISKDNETLSMDPSTAPNVYNVLLAQVTGGKAYQMQYGYIHVDGRWM